MDYKVNLRLFLVLVLGLSLVFPVSSKALANNVLYPGVVWVSPSVLTPTSPSDLVSVNYQSLTSKRTFDRRVNRWVNRDSHVFEARFTCGRQSVLVVVNSELSLEQAGIQANRFARILGQLPFGSRKAILEIWVHPGYEPAGGGNSSILVHTDFADKHESFLEEVFLHESGHTSLDWSWNGVVNREKWLAAATADSRFISQYAADYPDREDVAESYGAFLLHELAITNPVLRAEAKRIATAIPNRIEYFRSLGPEFGPSRSLCAKYGPTLSSEQWQAASPQEKRIILMEQPGDAVRLITASSISDNGIILNAKLGTKLKRGSLVRVVLGRGDGVNVVTQRVGRAGRIAIQADVQSVTHVSVRDSRGKELARWRLSRLP